jgi:AraC-like DNA-binding protein
MPTEGSLTQRAQVLVIAARLVSKEFDQARTRKPGFLQPEEHMAQVFEELSEEEFLCLPADELASRFGCSRRHLTRLFHRFFGSSIADLRMELRLTKVASLLRNPHAKIIHIAEQCGFNQLSHFNFCFKRRFGMSPGQWRKNIPLQDGPTAWEMSGRVWPAIRPKASVARSAELAPVAARQASVGPLKVQEQTCAIAPLNATSTGSLQLIENVGS